MVRTLIGAVVKARVSAYTCLGSFVPGSTRCAEGGQASRAEGKEVLVADGHSVAPGVLAKTICK